MGSGQKQLLAVLDFICVQDKAEKLALSSVQNKAGRSAAPPPLTLQKLAPRGSHFSIIGMQVLDIVYHNSSTPDYLFAFFILPCL